MVKDSLAQQIEDYILKNKENFYRLAYSYVKNPEDALDIVQDSIYKAFSTMGHLKNPEYIKTWLYKIIVNTSLDLLRKRKRLVTVDHEDLSNFEPSRVDHYEDFDLKKAMEELPDHYRSIVILRFFEDLKIEEVASILNENVNTVKTRLYKALKLLKIKIDEESWVV